MFVCKQCNIVSREGAGTCPYCGHSPSCPSAVFPLARDTRRRTATSSGNTGDRQAQRRVQGLAAHRQPQGVVREAAAVRAVAPAQPGQPGSHDWHAWQAAAWQEQAGSREDEMRITITVNEEGKSMVAVSGAPGKSCLKATEGLDDALGNPPAGR